MASWATDVLSWLLRGAEMGARESVSIWCRRRRGGGAKEEVPVEVQ